MNIFGLFSRSGRQKIVKTLLDDNLTPEVVSSLVADRLTLMLNASGLPEDKSKTVADYVAKGTDLVKAVFKAAEDKVITPEECRNVLEEAFKMFNASLDGVLMQVKEAIVEKVP